ncbi:hypothetical protein [Methanolapillus ohkumae]
MKENKFSSISDIVNVSVSMFIGQLSVYEQNSNFDRTRFADASQEDNTPRIKISVSYSVFLDDELEKLCQTTQKNKSFIVRIALDNFFDYYAHPEKKKEIQKKTDFPASREELLAIIQEMIDANKTEHM